MSISMDWVPPPPLSSTFCHPYQKNHIIVVVMVRLKQFNLFEEKKNRRRRVDVLYMYNKEHIRILYTHIYEHTIASSELKKEKSKVYILICVHICKYAYMIYIHDMYAYIHLPCIFYTLFHPLPLFLFTDSKYVNSSAN